MFSKMTKLAKFDPVTVAGQVSEYLPAFLPRDPAKRKLLDLLLNIGVPFNRWLGLRIKVFEPERVVIESPEVVLRRNHVGTAHACAQALIGEIPAGLLVAQKFPLESYRFIISKLEIEYHKAGRGMLTGSAKAPEAWPELNDGEAWVDMKTEITNELGEPVATCRTRWQVKSWQRVERDRQAR
jgi:acyl-coenzyme A thioesterase PaaI-like protein